MKTRSKLIIWIITAAMILTSLSAFAFSAAAETTPTVDTVQKDIYANGTPIIIEAGTTEGYSKIKYGGTYLDLDPGTEGVQGEADLSQYNIYGGYYNSNYTGNTMITMTGGTVKTIYGGGYGYYEYSKVTGDTTVIISGGTVKTIYGGGNAEDYTTLTGNTNVIVSGGTINNIYGGGEFGDVIGNTNVTVDGESTFVESIYGGGDFGNVTGNTSVVIKGKAQLDSNVYGGGYFGNVTGNTRVTISENVTVSCVVGGGVGYSTASEDMGRIYGNTSVMIEENVLVHGHIFGGGWSSSATVNGNTTVIISGGTVKNDGNSLYGKICGGGNYGSVSGSTTTVILGGTVILDKVSGACGESDKTVGSSLVIKNNTAEFNYSEGITEHKISDYVTVPSGVTVTVQEGKTLYVEEGATLDIAEGASVSVGDGAYIINDGEVKLNGTITGNVNITSVVLSDTNITYSGTEIKPAVTVKLAGSDQQTVELRENIDYTLSYSSEEIINVGTYTVTVTGKAGTDYAGLNVTKSFTIHPATISDTTVSLSDDNLYFSNSEVSPGVIFLVNKDISLSLSSNDYDATFSPDNKNVGEVTMTITGKGNFTGTVIKNFNIIYFPSPALSEFNVSGHSYIALKENVNDNVYWFKDGADATVYPPYGSISTTLDGRPYGESVTFREGDEKKVYLRKTLSAPGNGIPYALTDAIDLSSILKWDSTAPTGEITLSPEIDVKSRWDGIDFKWFFESAQTLAVVAEDAESGIKSVEYYISNGKIDNMASIEEWKTYDEINRITLDKDGKYFVYVKITDNVGNVTYENTDGIVIFSDSTLNTTNINTVYKSTEEDQKISISLNGNTVNSVMVGGDELTKDTEYSVLDNGDISLKASYLNTLNAGQYTVTVMYNPQGESYVDAENNMKPADTDITLYVAKADPKYEIPTGLKAYHGQTRDDIALPIVPNGEWKWSDDPAVSTDLIGVGKKFFKASFIPNDQANYNNVYNVNFTIEVLPITVIPPMEDRTVFVYNGEEHTYGVSDTSEYNVEGNVKTFAGKHTVTVTLLDKDNYVWADGTTDDLEYEFVIARAPSIITAKPAANDLTYNGEHQTIAKASMVSGGKMLYSVSYGTRKCSGIWYESIPTVKEAGKYYVWFKVNGDENHEDIAPDYIEVVVKQKAVNVVWGETEFAYDGEYHKPTATLVGVFEGDVCEAEISGLRKTLGWHTARVVALSDPNYVVVENESVSFTISDSKGVHESEIKAREEERAEKKAQLEAEAEKTADVIVDTIIEAIKKALMALVTSIFAR